jgi:hypothetical protein
MSHVASETIGHNKEFWDNFKFLLGEARDAGLYNAVDYSTSKQEYCGMTISDNPLFS